MARILIADDEKEVAAMLRKALTAEGYDVTCVHDGVNALAELRRQSFDLAILDINMPSLDGYQVCLRLRNESMAPGMAVLFLTGHGGIEDKLSGFQAGGDDYLTKPFHIDEFLARVKALLRRFDGYHETTAEPESAPTELKVSSLALNLNTYQVRCGDRVVELTPIEFDLLKYLMEHPDEVHSAKSLLREVWHDSDSGLDTGVVRWHMKKLRGKIELDPRNPQFIRTVFRHGYIL